MDTLDLFRNVKPPPLSSRIEEKIAWAEACLRRHGPVLRNDRSLAGLLYRLRENISASRAAMAETGIVGLCRECEMERGGSCCGAGIENRYDVWLLLTNLLLEGEMPRSRHQAGGCFFLGSHGCLLQARHVLCVDYVCARIKERVPAEKMSTLREKEGKELETLFLLKERIRKAVAELEGGTEPRNS